MANDIIDIDVFQTVENVEITVEPNLTTVNITDSVAVTDVTKLAILNNLSDLNNVSTARTNLGLGTLATQSGTFTDKANLASPTFTGVPLAPTAAANTNTTQIATTAFATGAVSGKMNAPSLTVNTIPKALTASTIGNSRIVDTGTYLGIGTVNTPTKDITLRGLDNREIGVEDSNNITEGKNLKLTAGRTINTVPSAGFVALGQPNYAYREVVAMNNGDMLFFVNGGTSYKQINSTGNLILFTTNIGMTVPLVAVSPSNNSILYATDIGGAPTSIIKKSIDGGLNFSNIAGEPARTYSDLCVMPNQDVYAIVASSGGVFKMTGGTGNFVDMGFTTRAYKGFVVMPNGDLYITVINGDVYKMLSGTSTLTALGQINRAWNNGYTFGGDVYIRDSSLIYKQTDAVGNFISTGIADSSGGSLNHVSVSINNNVYSPRTFVDVFVQFNNGVGTPDLNGGALQLTAGTGKGTGASDIEMYTGSKLASGTDMQSLTLRAKINNEGLMTLPSVTNALISAGGAKAIITKEYADANYSGGGGGGGSTNLSTTYAPTTVTVVSDTGTDAEIKAVDGTDAGIVTVAQKATWDGKQDALGFTPYNATNPSGFQTAIQVQTIADAKVANTITNGVTTSAPNQDVVFDALSLKVSTNTAISGATKTKITYDAKGLVTAGADASLNDLSDVNINTPLTDQILKYDGIGEFRNGSIFTANISDFNSATRAQTEAELVAGTNITITPSGTGATRQLTISSSGGGGATSGSGTVPSGNITWTGTAPTSVNHNTYEWEEDNNVVNLRINLSYTVSGNSQTIVIDLPSDAPTPKNILGFTNALEIVAFGSGMMFNIASSLPGSAGRYCLLRRNAGNTGYEIVVTHGTSISVRTVALTIQYFK